MSICTTKVRMNCSSSVLMRPRVARAAVHGQQRAASAANAPTVIAKKAVSAGARCAAVSRPAYSTRWYTNGTWRARAARGAWRVVRGAWCVVRGCQQGARRDTHTHTHEWHLAHATVQCACSVWRAMAGNEAHASRRDPIDQLDRTLHRRDGAHATQLGGPGVGAPLRELLRRELALGLEVSGAWLLRRRWMGESGEQWDPRSEAFCSRVQRAIPGKQVGRWRGGWKCERPRGPLTGLLRRAACRSCAARQRRCSWPPARRRGGGGREGPLA